MPAICAAYLRHIAVIDSVKPVSAHFILVIQLRGQAVQKGLGRERLMRGGIKHSYVGNIRQQFLGDFDTDQYWADSAEERTGRPLLCPSITSAVIKTGFRNRSPPWTIRCPTPSMRRTVSSEIGTPFHQGVMQRMHGGAVVREAKVLSEIPAGPPSLGDRDPDSCPMRSATPLTSKRKSLSASKSLTLMLLEPQFTASMCHMDSA